ncbi:hypothetical protein Tco_0848139 [Tanacetum coccineum]
MANNYASQPVNKLPSMAYAIISGEDPSSAHNRSYYEANYNDNEGPSHHEVPSDHINLATAANMSDKGVSVTAAITTVIYVAAAILCTCYSYVPTVRLPELMQVSLEALKQ